MVDFVRRTFIHGWQRLRALFSPPPPKTESKPPDPVPDRPPITHIDLTSQPYDETTLWLQNLMLYIIDTILFEQPQRVHQHLQNPKNQHIYSLAKRTKEPHDKLVKQAVAEEITLAAWREMTVLETERLLGIHIHGFQIPNDTWEMLALRAWQTPKFTYDVTQGIEGYLRQRVWYHTGDTPLAEFHINTFWLLLAGFPFKKLNTPQQNAIAHLRKTAMSIVLKDEQWAGYWDQWLLWQAYKRWQADARWAEPFSTELQELPICTYGKQPVTNPPPFVNPVWARQTPGWLLDLLTYEIAHPL